MQFTKVKLTALKYLQDYNRLLQKLFQSCLSKNDGWISLVKRAKQIC